ncbi:hypothetical protein E2C01_034416 [Portunus trituberculatus]|uniref:HTH psq-type domain-containing protein n=1 Tax=Portunus trituberculatus TaxID=210409 RepID=A0A5B7F6Z6_PORTR|nr:hypothetical protein [Portunus trituberculatus]
MMSSIQTATTSAGELKAKRSRISLFIEKKLVTVKCQEGGNGANFITRTLQLPQSTVSIVIKQAASVKKACETAFILTPSTR